jgi:hypothetical protein
MMMTARALTVLVMMLCLGGNAVAQTAPTSTLTWTANTESDLAGYKLYRGLFPCPTTGGLPTPAYKDMGKVTTYTDTLPTGTTDVCYDITAYDLSGNESGHSLKVSKSFAAAPPVPTAPATPVLTASAITSTSVVLTWPVVTGVSVNVRMAPAPIGYGWGSAASVPCPTGSPCTITGLTPGASVDFQAVAFVPSATGSIFSPISAPITVKLLAAPDTTPPAVPGGLQVASATPDQVVIVASVVDCRRVTTSTTGSTSTQQIRTVRCVR